MIVEIKKAILHILDGVSGISVFSDTELDMEDKRIESYIIKHIEKVYGDSGLRIGEFNEKSGFKYHMTEYVNGRSDIRSFSMSVAEKMYDALKGAETADSADLVVCDCVINEVPEIAVLKFDNKSGFTHQVKQDNGIVKNDIINHHAILPSVSQKISEYAFINKDNFSIKYKGKKRKIDGENIDMMAEIVLDGIFDISAKESFNAVKKIARSVADDNGRDSIETEVKIKKFVKDAVVEDTYIEPERIAETVFDTSPSMRQEFIRRTQEANVPEKVEIDDYVAKRAVSNIRLTTDIGVELSFPADYYTDGEHINIINNDDGTLSIRINCIGEIKNK